MALEGFFIAFKVAISAPPNAVLPELLERHSVVGKLEIEAKRTKFSIRNALVLTIEGTRHRRQFSGLEGLFGRWLFPHQGRGIGHHILRRRRLVIGDIEDAILVAS